MKTLLHFFYVQRMIPGFPVFMILLFLTFSLQGQVSIPKNPRSFQKSLNSRVPAKVMPPVNVAALRAEDKINDKLNVPYRFAKAIMVSYNLENSGEWEELEDGSRIWRLKIASRGAKSLNFLYDDFYIPEGGEFYIYDEKRKQVIGALGHHNNRPSRTFATRLLWSDVAILEYYEPASARGKSVISISQVGHGYRGFQGMDESNSDLGRSGACQVNVNCSPEGDNWQVEKRSVAKMIINGTGLCTGALVNNSAQDRTPYFLTADHCIDGTYDAVSSPDANIVFYWNFERTGCANTGSVDDTQTTSGATVLANPASSSVQNTSDFALLRLDTNPDDPYNVYFAGFDASGNQGSGGVGIHHPAGDAKKIATHNITPTSVVNNNYWRIFWLSTPNGWSVTEGGSSGSPLFNSSKRILGQLFGGFAGGQPNCSDPANDEGDYGKLSVSWTNGNAASNSRRLDVWLDPVGGGTTTVVNGLNDLDKVAPVLSGVPGDITVECDNIPAPAVVTATDDIDGTVSVTLTTSTIAGSCPNDYTLVRIWSATDAAGNTTTDSQSIFVYDNTDPVLTVPANMTVSTDLGTCEAVVDFTATATDNCGAASISYSKAPNTAFPLGETTVSVTATDKCGNATTSTFKVLVEDNEGPLAVCQDTEVFLEPSGSVSISPSQVDGGSSDNCSIASMTVIPNSFTTMDVGDNTVTLTVTDGSSNTASCEATVLVKKRPTVLVYMMEYSKQYSDEATLKAVLTDGLSGSGLEGKTIDFTLGSQTASAVTDINGEASTTLVITQAPGAYTMESAFTEDAIYLGSTDSDPFTIEQEDAKATYTGALFASTSGVNSSSAIVTLSATLQDITAVPADPDHDVFAGDILKASLAFKIQETGEMIPAALGYVDASDKKTAVATVNWSTDIGGFDSESYTVELVVNDHYTRSGSSDDYVIVTVAKPLNDFVAGGGYIIPTNSAGEKASDVGKKNNFGFNIKFNKKGTNLQGNINTIIRRTEADGFVHVYQIKGNKMTSLAVQPIDEETSTAVFNGKASIQDITDPNNPVSVDGNASLQVNMTDMGEPGSSDKIAITIWKKSGGLWFSSDWDGVQTNELLLAGGNLAIRGGATISSSANIGTEPLALSVESLKSGFYNYPSPFSDKTTIAFVLDKEEPYTLEVYDLNGKLVRKLTSGTAHPGKLYEFEMDASEMPKGMFITRLSTPSSIYNLRIIKAF